MKDLVGHLQPLADPPAAPRGQLACGGEADAFRVFAIADPRERMLDLRANGARRARTADLLGAIQALSQLSYSPAEGEV